MLATLFALGLALNFSVFYNKVMDDHKRACKLGESALTEARKNVDEEIFCYLKSIIELFKQIFLHRKEEERENNVRNV